MAECIFCAIAGGEIPSTEVLSTDLVYAFRDLNPVAPTHVLVIPREHIVDAAEITADHGDLLGEMFDVARRVAEADGVAERRLSTRVQRRRGLGQQRRPSAPARARWPPARLAAGVSWAGAEGSDRPLSADRARG